MIYFYQNQYLKTLELSCEMLGLLRGYSAFEYIRTYDKKPFCLKGHLARFYFSIEKMNLCPSYTLEELEEITLKLISHETQDCGIKWYASGSKSVDGLRHDGRCEMFAFTIPMTPQPSSFYQSGIKAITVCEKRPLPEAKTTAYFTACQILSQNKTVQEIIYIDALGQLLEAATSNLFLVKDKKIYTSSLHVLHGITREVVLHLCKNRYEVIFTSVPLSSLSSFDEVFITATNKEIMPVSKIDELEFKIGPVTRDLMQLFEDFKATFSNIDLIPELYQGAILLKS